jgi:hypothetical protein
MFQWGFSARSHVLASGSGRESLAVERRKVDSTVLVSRHRIARSQISGLFARLTVTGAVL